MRHVPMAKVAVAGSWFAPGALTAGAVEKDQGAPNRPGGATDSCPLEPNRQLAGIRGWAQAFDASLLAQIPELPDRADVQAHGPRSNGSSPNGLDRHRLLAVVGSNAFGQQDLLLIGAPPVGRHATAGDWPQGCERPPPPDRPRITEDGHG